jgi:DNA repair ATPase RecN
MPARATLPGMGDIDEKISEALDKARESRLNGAIAALVALSATLMALNNVKDGNIVQAMQQAQANGVDEWAYYQAKGTKQNLAAAAREQIELMRDTTPNASPETRAVFDKRIAEYTAQEKKYETEKEDIKRKAEGFQKQYDELNRHDDQFDMAEALLSVSIALFGVTALTRKRWLLVVALVFASFGAVLGWAGFFGWNLHPDWLANLLS